MKIDPKKKYRTRNGVLTVEILPVDTTMFHVSFSDGTMAYITEKGGLFGYDASFVSECDLVEEVTEEKLTNAHLIEDLNRIASEMFKGKNIAVTSEASTGVEKQRFSDPPNVFFAAAKLEKILEWDKYKDKIPFLKFPEGLEVRILPPFSGAMVRFRVKRTDDIGGNSVSVYLDCHEILGCFGEPYWEIYPYHGDVCRIRMNDTEELMKKLWEAATQVNGILIAITSNKMESEMNIEQPQYFQGEFIPGEWYEDRAGNRYRFIGFDGDWPIFKGDFSERYFQRYRDGTADGVCNPPGQGDIIRHVPKPKPKVKRTVWMNIYKDNAIFAYLSKERADSAVRKELNSFDENDYEVVDRIACIPVEIEYEEGEGL